MNLHVQMILYFKFHSKLYTVIQTFLFLFHPVALTLCNNILYIIEGILHDLECDTNLSDKLVADENTRLSEAKQVHCNQ